MKQTFRIASLLVLASFSARAQVTITSQDMFNEPGLTYRVYSNLATKDVPAGGIIGDAGAGRIWDFSTGPKDVAYQFDIKNATDIDPSISGSFPGAELVEAKAEVKPDQTLGDAEYIFFTQAPDKGRVVHGPYSDQPTSSLLASLGALGVTISPAWVFDPPVVDFPNEINFGQEWSSTTSWSLTTEAPDTGDGTDPTDPFDPGSGLGGFFSIDLQITETTSFKVDAWGTAVLPDELGGQFEQVLRVNSQVIDEYTSDLTGTGEQSHVATVMYRIYYWLMPGKGIVAQIVSKSNSDAVPGSVAQMPPDNFTTAAQYWRLFSTNKKPSSSGGPNAGPQPVTDLRIRANNGQVLLSWSKASGATHYQLDYSTGGNPLVWKTLGSYTNQLLALDLTTADPQRFYRVISLK